jgi:hypothetical protein
MDWVTPEPDERVGIIAEFTRTTSIDTYIVAYRQYPTN